MGDIYIYSFNHSYQNWTGPDGSICSTENRALNRSGKYILLEMQANQVEPVEPVNLYMYI